MDEILLLFKLVGSLPSALMGQWCFQDGLGVYTGCVYFMIPWFLGNSESVRFLFQLPEENYAYSGKFHLVTANFVLLFSKLSFFPTGKGILTGRLTFT